MGSYVIDCEISEMDLRVPREHAEDLVRYFDGRHPGERGSATASVTDSELLLESRGGRLSLQLKAGFYVSRELELFDDRGAAFFSAVVNLFVAYRGKLRCQLEWGGPKPAGRRDPDEVVVESGRSSWTSQCPAGSWLMAPAPANPADIQAEEQAFEKIEEGQRYFAEYQRLKRERTQQVG